MSHSIAPGDPILDALAHEVLTWTGYRPDPSHSTALRRAVRAHVRRGVALPDLLERARARDPDLMASLLQAVSVPETYFFRQPEHFEWIADEGVARFGGRPVVRAWSAGCATGEEAYSLAACLLARMPPGVRVEVLGTDLLARSLEVAQAGAYGTWSQRLAGPILYPVCGPMRGRHAVVLDAVRAVARFETHNLLDPPPGVFDVILCRNVLLYFSNEAARVVLSRLSMALTPDGVVAFGTLDVSGVPQGLAQLGPTELNMFVHETARPAKEYPARSSMRPPRPASILPAALAASVPPHVAVEVAMHLRVLASIECGDHHGAEHELSLLRDKAPDYLPGLFEHALLFVRHGDRDSAVGPMRDLLRRLEPLGESELLPGPERLPVSYYRAAARAFLSGSAGASTTAEVES